MKRVVVTTVLMFVGAASALSQTSQPPSTPQATPSVPSADMPKSTDAPKTPTAPSVPPANSGSAGSSMDKSNLGGPAAGANSFTENQAKARLESGGYSNVSGLKKDDNGIWRATGQKDGKSETVTLDYQGNISTSK